MTLDRLVRKILESQIEMAEMNLGQNLTPDNSSKDNSPKQKNPNLTKEEIRRHIENFYNNCLDFTSEERNGFVHLCNTNPEVYDEWWSYVENRETSHYEGEEPYLSPRAIANITGIVHNLDDNSKLSFEKLTELKKALSLFAQWGDLGIPTEELKVLYRNRKDTNKSIKSLIDTLNREFSKLDNQRFNVEIKHVSVWLMSGNLVDWEVVALVPFKKTT